MQTITPALELAEELPDLLVELGTVHDVAVHPDLYDATFRIALRRPARLLHTRPAGQLYAEIRNDTGGVVGAATACYIVPLPNDGDDEMFCRLLLAMSSGRTPVEQHTPDHARACIRQFAEAFAHGFVYVR